MRRAGCAIARMGAASVSVSIGAGQLAAGRFVTILEKIMQIALRV